MTALVVAKESLAAARGQAVWSFVTAAMVAAMVIAVMMTTGRAVAGQREVLGTLDDAGTRTILVRADGGLDPRTVSRVRGVGGVEWVAAFSAAVDATNTLVPGGQAVSARIMYSPDASAFGIPEGSADQADTLVLGRRAYASESTLELLGLPEAAGSVTTTEGAAYPVVGKLASSELVQTLEPVVVVPDRDGDRALYEQMIVVVSRPDRVGPVANAITPLIVANDPSQVTIETSESLATLRDTVRDQLGATGRAMIFGMLATTAVVVGIVQFSLVMFRRRDYGRRRALGATRGFVVRLVVAQTMWLACVGVIVGTVVSAVSLQVSTGYWPGLRFTAGLAALSLLAGCGAAIIPAFVASRRDPLVELRVP